MTAPSVTEHRALLEHSPEEREARGVTDADVAAALRVVVEHGSREQKEFVGCSFPDLAFDYEGLAGDNQHPLVFRDCSFGDLSLEHADVRLPVRFEDCEFGEVSLRGARFEYDLAMRDSTVTGPLAGRDARFDSAADFSGTRFLAPVTLDEATFGDDTAFDDARFAAAATFRAAAFHGTSNELGDNVAFSGTVFDARTDFGQATFEYATFAGATFRDPVHFEEASFDGDVAFRGVTFHGEAVFDEVVFSHDTTFAAATFHARTVFRGALFEGGARTKRDDASFERVTFAAEANFREAEFRSVNVESATFEARALFERAAFDDVARFVDATFESRADFDETRFDGVVDFTDAWFGASAAFRGAIFAGEARHLRKNAIFEGAHFADAADFNNATFRSANFTRTAFGGTVDFTSTEFRDEFEFLVEPAADHIYVDFTHASLKEGSIVQPAGGRVHYDLTWASLGAVSITAEREGWRTEVLDYFRFCNTEFDEFDGYEFDFSAHTYYLDRNDWELHKFEEPAGDPEYALEMTPANVESTYLRAKNAATAGGYVKAAGEFRVKRQRHARRKNLAIAGDARAEWGTRLGNLARAAENYFLDVTCGYGIRLRRILLVFLLVPLFPAFLYTFGGPAFLTEAGQVSSLGHLASPAGLSVFYQNLHFSYITFLTIGYGGIIPLGVFARLLAGLEVYLSVILGGLVLYALIKRSEL